jgi:Ca2+-transporting ATPase
VTVDEALYKEDRESIVPKTLSKGAENHRDNPDPFLLAYSLVVTGSGRAVVCAVGTHTRYSKTIPAEEFKEDATLTPLQIRLEGLAGFLGKFGFFAGGITVALILGFLAFRIMVSDSY